MPPTSLEDEIARQLPEIRSMGRMLFDPVWAERDHLASHMEIMHILAGEVELFTPGASHKAGPGQTLFIKAGTRHRDEFDGEAGLEIFFCTVDWPRDLQEEYFSRVSNDTLAKLSESDRNDLSSIFDQLRSDLRGPAMADRLVARSRVLTVLLLALRSASRQEPSGGASARHPSYGQERRRSLVLQAKAYLEKHYAQCISLDDIASSLNISSYHLSHVFSEESDFSLFGFLTALRMNKARALLIAGGRQVAEVARAVGYENANYFSKAFRKHVGCSPRQFAAGSIETRNRRQA